MKRSVWSAAFIIITSATLYFVFRQVDFRFERPWAAAFFACIPAVVIAQSFMRHKGPRFRMSRAHDIAKSGHGSRTRFAPILTSLRATALALLVVTLMGPQSIHALGSDTTRGIDIVVTLDASLSMRARDVKPNRFDAAKQVIAEFVVRRPNDRVGAVIFGQEAFTLLPLTTDKQALHSVLQSLQLGSIDGAGTAIGNALATALNRLRKSKAKSKVAILLTDGNSNSGNVSPVQAADFARVLGVKVFTVLMGRPGRGNGLFEQGGIPVDPALLEKMAKQTGGRAFRAVDRATLEQTFHSILDELETSKIEDAGKLYGELYPNILIAALWILAFEFLLRAVWLQRWP